MSDKSADTIALQNFWMFCFLAFSDTFVDREWQLAYLESFS